KISAGYFRVIRNYYRFGWVIPYLFGASPAICSSFLQGKPTSLPFEKTECGMYYLPYATSLRLSDLGYTNKSQSNLGITFNDLYEYVAGLKQAIKTPRNSASEGDSPLRVTRFGRIGAYSSFSICSTLLLICSLLPSFSIPIFAYSSDGVLIACLRPATYSQSNLGITFNDLYE
ncbi:hypothetical protein ACUODF_32725, partial [Escherichia coli]